MNFKSSLTSPEDRSAINMKVQEKNVIPFNPISIGTLLGKYVLKLRTTVPERSVVEFGELCATLVVVGTTLVDGVVTLVEGVCVIVGVEGSGFVPR